MLITMTGYFDKGCAFHHKVIDTLLVCVLSQFVLSGETLDICGLVRQPCSGVGVMLVITV